MIQSREGPSLPSKASASPIVESPGGEDLHGDLAPEMCVPRPIDDAHASLADFLQDVVVPESRPDHETPPCWAAGDRVEPAN
jgi:hypothetical protein